MKKTNNGRDMTQCYSLGERFDKFPMLVRNVREWRRQLNIPEKGTGGSIALEDCTMSLCTNYPLTVLAIINCRIINFGRG